jgi:hypothetical protein
MIKLEYFRGKRGMERQIKKSFTLSAQEILPFEIPYMATSAEHRVPIPPPVPLRDWEDR